jgi:SAM-dependent methyltransferase
LNSIELNLLGNIKGKSILHLQCHFGQDTISFVRLGAIATGVDLSDKSIESANELAKKAGVKPTFICCNVYDLPLHLTQQFDIVFTSYGTIGWLPDLNKWAKIVSQFLKPNGKFVFAEFHPVVWMFDDDFKKIGYNYFNTGEIIETESGTYANRDAAITQEYVMWNHGMSEVLNSLIKNGLEINSLDEFDYSPYNCFRKTEEFEPKKYRIKHLENKIPMVYTIVATKKQT